LQAPGVRLEDQVLASLRDQVGLIILGTVFLFVGLVACCIAAIRGRGGVRILVWFGILNLMYGAILLAQAPAVLSMLPRSTWASRPYVIPIINYLIFLPALLFWMELSRGRIRRFVRIAIIATAIIGVAGVYSTIFTQSSSRLMPYSNLMSILVFLVLLALALVIAIPALSRRFRVLHNNVSSIGTLVFAVAALYMYLASYLHLPEPPLLEPLAFAAFIFSMGYTAADKIFTDSRRLLTIEKELAIARDIQNSILPNSVPEIEALDVYAAYFPMTAVAGDFYEFIPVDRSRVGVLVADVSGHGVPAALIAAMIKVAMQSVASCAREPHEVLRGLNRILSGQLRGQLISAAYLWLDTETGKALYSAAGHPPLLCWRTNRLERIESNGLLIGVLPDSDYPVCEISLNSGDRFLLYTDGVVEPENAAGDAFGDHKLEEVIRKNQSRSPSELSDQLLSEIRRWQPASVTQQDDITLIIIDVA
jgi:sigma-B regulation protein RsbU (phosphoserine phosphatase)